MHTKYFFDVPVYRLAEDKFYRDQKKYIEKMMYPGSPQESESLRRMYARNPEQKKGFENHLRDYYGGAWTINEIIGWIQLHFLDDQIRGEYWALKSKRVVRTRRKVFEYKTWKLAPEIDVEESATNPEIFQLIKQYLLDCEKELKGRYIDVRRLDILGPFVDWRSLIES
jgi:hypothetical protein